VITTNRTARRATKTTSGGEKATGRGVPRRALADGVVERRRTSRRRDEPQAAPGIATPERGERLPDLLSASEHYRLEVRRRADRITGDLATLLAEAKAEYEAHINAPRPAGKGGRPKKKRAAPATEIELDEADAFGAEEEE
jgi:hypothetical protein